MNPDIAWPYVRIYLTGEYIDPAYARTDLPLPPELRRPGMTGLQVFDLADDTPLGAWARREGIRLQDANKAAVVARGVQADLVH